MSEIGRNIRAALAAVICAAILSGCSPKEKVPVNVYLPGELVKPDASSSVSSSAAVPNYPPISPSTSGAQSSSSSSSPSVTPPQQSEPIAPIDNYRGKWYYFCISEKRKRIYERLYNCAKNNVAECDVSDLLVTEQDVYEAYWAFDYENPQFLRLGSGYEITYIDHSVSNKVKTVKINYGRTSGETGQTTFEARAETVLENARALKSDYERLRYVHDWIVNNTTYTKGDEPYLREADGPIVYGEAVCEGYSKAFMYFAQSLGYPCICSVGNANLEEHMWNMVKIGGSWYNVDATWDDPQSPDGAQTLVHDYFLINDAKLRLDHRVERPVMLPNAPNGFFPYGYDQDNSSNTSGSREGVTLTDS